MTSRSLLRAHRGLALPALAAVLSVSACAANPGPPPIVEPDEVAQESAAADAQATQGGQSGADDDLDIPSRASLQLAIGVDPVASGLNPHLVKDDSVFVRALADLVLPSAFEDGVLNRDLLKSAQRVALPSDAAQQGIVQTVRYELTDEAQWSDGTPITVGDFEFLYKSMINTSGVVDAAPYRAISRIRSSNGGRTIDVDFKQAFKYWPVLFEHLLPSHLVSDFGSGLDNGIPASGSRYSFKNFDRQVGTLVVVRNDRFWGASPARHDEITFREVRSESGATDLLRAGQIQALDITPTQTSEQAISLLGNNNISLYNSGRQLQVVANKALSTAQRQQLQELIDPKLIAELAFGRTNNIELPEPDEYTGVVPTSAATSSSTATATPTSTTTTTPSSPSSSTSRTPPSGAPDPDASASTTLEELGRAVRIGVDPSDTYAQRAARAFVDVLTRHGISATLVTTDAQHLFGSVMRAGDVDAVVTWLDTPAVNQLQCAQAVGDSDTNSKVTANGANFSGFCNAEVDQQIADTLAGEISPEKFNAIVADINALGHYTTAIAVDRRLTVSSQDLTGMSEGLHDINSWTLQSHTRSTNTSDADTGTSSTGN